MAELLVLCLAEVIGGALQPCSHTRDTLVVLHTVRFETALAWLTLIIIFIIHVLVGAEWHETECPLSRLLDHQDVAALRDMSLLGRELLRL